MAWAEPGKVGTTIVTKWDGEQVYYECRETLVTWARGCGKAGWISPFGGRVHAAWGLALSAKIRDEQDLEADAIWSDDGIIVHLPDADVEATVTIALPGGAATATLDDPLPTGTTFASLVSAAGWSCSSPRISGPPRPTPDSAFRKSAGRSIPLAGRPSSSSSRSAMSTPWICC